MSGERERPAPSADPALAETLATLLGEQAALITGAMDAWFERLLPQAIGPPAAAAAATGAAVAASGTGSSPLAAHRAVPGTPETAVELARFDFADGWQGWTYFRAAQLLAGGAFEVAHDVTTPGIASPPLAIGRGGLLRVELTTDLPRERAVPLHLRITDASDTPLCADLPVPNGESEHFIYVPQRFRTVRALLLVIPPRKSMRVRVRRLVLQRVDSDDHFAHRVQGIVPATIASLASIPERSALLADTVASLLAQCAIVRVFLNGYPGVPPFLRHPRVQVRRSQDWDDRGDAGKFAWVAERDEAEWRIIADDDLIYPPDFAARMVEAVRRHERPVIAGVHGILLKQPFEHYYEPRSRHVFHFQSRLLQERTVHVLGTNTVCYHSDTVAMSPGDFMFPNMADLFLARYAHRRGIAMVTVARPRNWVRQNSTGEEMVSIYQESLLRTGSRFDTSWIQDAVSRSFAPLTLQPTRRPKLAFAVLAADSSEFERTMESWRRHRSLNFDWAVLVAATTGAAELTEHIGSLSIDHEMHVLPAGSDAAAMLQRAARLRPDAVLLASGGAEFVAPGWETAALSELPAGVSAIQVTSATAARLLVVPGAHLGIPNLDFAATGDAAAPEAARPLAAALRGSAKSVPMSAGVPARQTPPSPNLPPPSPGLTINRFFRRVLLINLDRRPDRLRLAAARLGAAGVAFERVSAVDGQSPGIRAEFGAYRMQAPVTVAAPHRVRSSPDFFMRYPSQTARVGFAETGKAGKAIRSPGAWAYLRTWERILERALHDGDETLLVLDDDVVLHRDCRVLFAAVAASIPADWLILQLGTQQHEWGAEWLTWRNPMLYATHGVAIGSHGVGLRGEILPFLFDQVRRMLLPFDTGALAAACGAFPDRCFVTWPNIAIQELGDSDIGSSAFQSTRTVAEAAAVYRWSLSDYDDLRDADYVAPAAARQRTAGMVR